MINWKVSPVTDNLAICEVKLASVLDGGIGSELPEGWQPQLIVGPFDVADCWMRVLLSPKKIGRYWHHGECAFCQSCHAYWPQVYFREKRWCPMCGTEN